VARGREARRAARAAEEAEMNEGTEGSNDEYSSDTAKCATPAHAYFAGVHTLLCSLALPPLVKGQLLKLCVRFRFLVTVLKHRNGIGTQ